MSYAEGLREPGGLIVEKRRLGIGTQDLLTVGKCVAGGWGHAGLSSAPREQGQEDVESQNHRTCGVGRSPQGTSKSKSWPSSGERACAEHLSMKGQRPQRRQRSPAVDTPVFEGMP